LSKVIEDVTRDHRESEIDDITTIFTELEDDEHDPTGIAYGELRAAFEHFNIELFDSALPPCLITLQRRRNIYGYFAPSRFRRADGTEQIHEIALNPQSWRKRTIEANLATLVHEMVHLQQHCFGNPSRRGYHNKEWAQMMVAVGLIPSTTGQPGGQQTGQKVTHYIQPGGRFAKACASFLELGYGLSFHDLTDDADGKERQNKTKFSCPGCGANAWGKPDLNIECRDCHMPMDGTKQLQVRS